MQQSDGWSRPHAASFAIKKSCLRQSNAFDKSVSSILPTPLLPKFFSIFLPQEEGMLSAVTLSKPTVMFRDNLIKVTMHLIKHTPFINFGESGKDTNGTMIFDIKFAFLFMNGYNVCIFQFWGKNWIVQRVIEVMMYKVRKYILFYYFHRDVISLTCFFLV